jgi:hypothetical protein
MNANVAAATDWFREIIVQQRPVTLERSGFALVLLAVRNENTRHPPEMKAPLSVMCALLSATVHAQTFPEPSALPAKPELPDPLTTFAGDRVSTAQGWNEVRKPELKALIQHYEYGVLPPKPDAPVAAEVLHKDPEAFGGKATLREIRLTWGMQGQSIQLLLVTPNAVKSAPVFLGLNFTGNHTVVNDPKVALPTVWVSSKESGNRAREEDRGRNMDTWNVETLIARGYAVATFFNGDVVPDEPKLAEEALARFRSGGTPDRGPADAGTIAVWAWCLHRAVDYLTTDNSIDPKRIALVGHSRNGKTALLAAALDERVAMVIPSQAGCGGTAPARVNPELATPQKNGRPRAETVAVINKAFPHWFSGNFKQFNDAPEKLPFDHHAIIALCAPRPVLLSNATEDTWANPAGQFEMLRGADAVYRLVGKDGLGAEKMPAPGQLLDSRLGYFIREGKHSMNLTDWEAWLRFADKWLR